MQVDVIRLQERVFDADERVEATQLDPKELTAETAPPEWSLLFVELR